MRKVLLIDHGQSRSRSAVLGMAVTTSQNTSFSLENTMQRRAVEKLVADRRVTDEAAVGHSCVTPRSRMTGLAAINGLRVRGDPAQQKRPGFRVERAWAKQPAAR
jgi:hypothetical protein